MKPTPLFLKIRGSSETPQFHLCADNAISFQDQKYEFSSIFQNVIPQDALQLLTKTSATLILAGPSGSGKTTSLLEILRFFTTLGANVLVNACEVNKNNSFVDLIDTNASKRYLSSLPFDNQLKKMALDHRVVSKIMREKVGGSTPVNTPPTHSCLLVNIYHDSKMLTLVDLVANEKFDAGSASTATKATASSMSRRVLSGSPGGRSQTLMTSLVFRRVSSVNISFIMHLDQEGEPDLIKSSLTSVIQTVQIFSMGPKKTTRTGTTSASVSAIPNYAKPTVSSATPSRPLSSYKVSKPPKRRVGVTVQKVREVAPRQRVLLRQRNLASSPVSDLREVQQLKETVAHLQSKLSEDKSSYVKSIESLQMQMRSIKNESLVNLQAGLLNARSGFERVSNELGKQTQLSTLYEEQLTQLKANKSSIDSKLAETLQMLERTNDDLTNARESSAEEKRSMAAAFESELKLMREASATLEEKIASLTQANNECSSEISQLASERDSLIKETENLRLQIIQKQDEKKLLKEEVEETKRQAVSGEESTKALHDEILEKLTQLQLLQQQLSSERALLAEKTSGLVEHMAITKQLLDEIESLKRQVAAQNEEHSKKEELRRQQMDSEAKENRDEIERVESLVNDITSKYEQLQKVRQAHIEEMSALRANLEEKEAALAAAQKYQEKCFELESTIKQLSDKAKQQEVEHEKQVHHLNEELAKARGPAESPKKLMDFPDLDFNNGNNTFSSIDIFEDHTNYNFFKPPVTGRSPIASPTRVLTESNVRANTDPKPVEKPSAAALQLAPNQENPESNEA